MNNWFAVDKTGLAKLLWRAGPRRLLSLNRCRTLGTRTLPQVDVTVEPVPGTRNAQISVIDDDPDGFADLRDAYTLFAESRKTANACKMRPIQSRREVGAGPGGNPLGSKPRPARSSLPRPAAALPAGIGVSRGRVSCAVIPMTIAEIEETIEVTKRLIVPAGVITRVNGRCSPRPPARGRLRGNAAYGNRR